MTVGCNKAGKYEECSQCMHGKPHHLNKYYCREGKCFCNGRAKCVELEEETIHEAICIEIGCLNKAGTAWGPHWCEKHDNERREKISKSLQDLANSFEEGRT